MRVVVFGYGPIGLLTIFLAARAGAEVTAIDPVAARRETAARLGASSFEVAPAAADLAVDAAGFEETWRGSVDAVRNGGSVVVVGLGRAEGTFPMATIVRRAVTVRGQFAYSRRDFARAVEILAEGDLDLGWISEVAPADGAEAFANLVERLGEYSKVLLTP
ncbi:MAG: Alcohol dehydrogenase GroES domain protein [Actinomycetia bacterium]|nr:Alcohol dehydrogenase GroES domain protein [Actinomycetes bacterium]